MISLKTLKPGEFIKLKNRIYEVITSEEETEWIPSTEKKRRFLQIYLHERDGDHLYPTHVLFYYFDIKKAYLLKIKYEQPPEWDEQPGNSDVGPFQKQKQISLREIKKIKKDAKE